MFQVVRTLCPEANMAMVVMEGMCVQSTTAIRTTISNAMLCMVDGT